MAKPEVDDEDNEQQAVETTGSDREAAKALDKMTDLVSTAFMMHSVLLGPSHLTPAHLTQPRYLRSS